MALLIPVVVLIIQHTVTQALSPLPQLSRNRLDEGTARTLPNASRIYCGAEQLHRGKLGTLTLREALTTTNFEKHPFTSSIVAGTTVSGNEARFKIVEIKDKRYLYALQLAPTGEKAYWLRQGVTKQGPYPYLDIPQHPTADQPKYVFTADFSGGSWTVTPLSNGYLRLRRDGGTQEGPQFNKLTPALRGGPVSYAMQYKDYGYTVNTKHLAENVYAFAYMHYSGGSWNLHLQRKTCSPAIGPVKFSRRTLFSVTFRDARDNVYSNKPISSTEAYRIPNV